MDVTNDVKLPLNCRRNSTISHPIIPETNNSLAQWARAG